MPMIRDYACDQGHSFEFMTMTSDETVTCPTCGSSKIDVVVSGGIVFGTIVPSYKGSLRNKAGFVHKYANRPAERVSVTVPKKV